MTNPTGNTDRHNHANTRAGQPVTRVLIAEDSATIRHHLVGVIEETPGMQVVGQARDGQEALRLVAELRPDVVSMDINMPRLDGLEATRHIMAQTPTPVVVVSGLVEQDIELSFQALEAGALAVVAKPPDRSSPGFPEKQRQLVRTLAAMAGVSVVRRGYQNSTPAQVARPPVPSETPELIVIGASAGGPSALSKLLGGLPADLPAPVLIVQHIASEFVPGLARWLDKSSPLVVRVADDGQLLQPGMALLAPGSAHLQVQRRGRGLATRLVGEQGPHRYQPSVNVLFESAAAVCKARAVGLVLTGMGDDGAAGLLAMRQAKAHTLAQDKASATVYGMPGAAVAAGAVEQVLSLAELPPALIRLMQQ